MRSLDIAYLGNHQPDVAPAKRWSTESQVASTLEALGHRVVRLQENATEWDVVEYVARKADMLLWTTTWNRDPAGGLACLDRLALRGLPTVAFHLDLFWGLNREAKLREEPFWRCAHVFTADGGHQERFAAAGINHRWLPPAIYAPDVKAGRHRVEYACDAGFVGSYPYPHAEHAQARRDLIRFVQSEARGRFRHWRGGIRGDELADLYASVKVVVGDSCLAGKLPRYWSDRIPETLGRRGFLIHPYVPGIEGHYRDGEHLRLYEAGDFFQLRELLRHYLANEEERLEIARAGQEHVRAHHTYEHRMGVLLAAVLEGKATPWEEQAAAVAV